jgi:hypothetical protein
VQYHLETINMVALSKACRRERNFERFEDLIFGGLLTMGHTTGRIPIETCDGWAVETTLGDALISVRADKDGYFVCCTFKDVKRARKAVACDNEGQWCFHLHGEPWTAAAAILDAILYFRVC